MLERRLYFHIDWALIAAVARAVRDRPRDDLQHHRRRRRASTGRSSTRSRSASSRWSRRSSIDYRTLADKSHLFYLGLIGAARRRDVLRLGADGSRSAGSISASSTCSRRSSPRRRSRWCSRNCSARAAGRSLTNNELFIAVVLTAIPLLLIARQPDLGTAVTLLPILLVVTFAAGLPREVSGGARRCRRACRRRSRGSSRCRTISASASKRFSIPSRMRAARAISRFRRASPSAPAACGAKDFGRGRRVSCGSCPWRTTTSSSRCWPRSRGSSASSSCSGLYLFVIMRALEAAKLAKDRLGAYLVLGVLATFTFQVIYNITMSAGLAPVKGLTLPLMSYGGSSMIATLAGFGLILNVRMRRFTNWTASRQWSGSAVARFEGKPHFFELPTGH